MSLIRRNGLEQLVLQGHVALRLETDAGAEDVDQGGALLAEGVDDGGAGRRQGSLEHVAEDGQDAVEAAEVGCDLFARRGGLPLDASHHLGDEDEVDDEGGGQEGVLADIEEAEDVSSRSRRADMAGKLTRLSGDRP